MQLLAFFLGIALLAGLAVFCGLDAALVSAFLAGGFCLLAAGFSASEGQAAQQGDSTSYSSKCFHCFSFI
jgi:uncharacterized membrane protein YphA (DoxX/SURF4 family)